jgi:hypothetical protein
VNFQFYRVHGRAERLTFFTARLSRRSL